MHAPHIFRLFVSSVYGENMIKKTNVTWNITVNKRMPQNRPDAMLLMAGNYEWMHLKGFQKTIHWCRPLKRCFFATPCLKKCHSGTKVLSCDIIHLSFDCCSTDRENFSIQYYAAFQLQVLFVLGQRLQQIRCKQYFHIALNTQREKWTFYVIMVCCSWIFILI